MFQQKDLEYRAMGLGLSVYGFRVKVVWDLEYQVEPFRVRGI
jgi:hypothetical protein